MEEIFEIEEVDILVYAERGEAVPHAKHYHVRIDGHRHTVDGPVHDRVFLLGLEGKTAEEYELVEEFSNPDENEVVDRTEKVDLRVAGLRGFVTAHKHHHPHLAHIKIDEVPYEIAFGPTTGATLRGLPPVPNDRDLWLERKGDDEKITPTTIVEVHDHMCFYTAPSTINPGGTPHATA